jgi:N-methylhydantoinase A
MPLDRDAALDAVAREIGDHLDLEPEAAAAAVMALATARMAGALEGLTIGQGLDPRSALLIGGGGASGLCVGAIAREIGARRVLMPATASVLSAFGGLHSDLVADFAASHATDTRTMDLDVITGVLGGLDDEIDSFLARVSRSDGEIEREFSVEARYRFQVWDLEIPLGLNGSIPTVDPERLEHAFHAIHERVFGVRDEGQLVECTTWRARGRAALAAPRAVPTPTREGELAPRVRATAYFPGLGETLTPRFDGIRLPTGQTVAGPAVIELPATTIVVYPGTSARRTPEGHLLLDIAEEEVR